MKTCKDCLHCNVCEKRTCSECQGSYCDECGIFSEYDGRASVENCTDFKDKSLVLDLPCKVGDTVYYAGIDTPVRFYVIGFSQGRMYCDNLEEYSELLDEGDIVEGEWYVHLDTTYGLSQMSPISEFGRTIFIGKNAEKAAEQALKEREKG